MKRKVSQGTRTLLVRDNEGEFEVTLPPGARVTFGPDVPYSRDRDKSYVPDPGRTYALRIYAGKGNDTLIGCFPKVEGFRPAELTLQRVVVRREGYDGTQYAALAEITKSGDVPRCWTIHRKHPTRVMGWSVPEGQYGSEYEAVQALEQMIRATEMLKKEPTKGVLYESP